MPPKSPRRPKRGEGTSTTGERIRTAALTLFRERGFDATTMRDVAEAAGMSLGAAYYYFPSKEAIVLAYYQEQQLTHERLAREAFAKTEDVGERIRAVFLTKLEAMKNDRPILGALTHTLGDPDSTVSLFSPETHEQREQSLRLFEQALGPASLDAQATRTLAVLLWTALLGMLLFFLHDRSKGNRRTKMLIEDAVSMMVPMLPFVAAPPVTAALSRVHSFLGEAGLVGGDDEATPRSKRSPARGALTLLHMQLICCASGDELRGNSHEKETNEPGTTVAKGPAMSSLFGAFLGSFVFDAGRYIVVAVPVFFLFWRWLGPRFRDHWLRPSAPDAPSIRRELAYSLSTAVMFSLVGATVVLGAKAGIFRLYLDVAQHGVVYLLASTLVLILLQDTYFYFTHRAMHHRLLFRAFHRVHHLSRHTSPFTAYAFSPLEAFIHAAFVPLMLLVMPLHPVALFLFLGFMMIRNVFGHLAIELYPAEFVKNRFWSMHTTTTHHALHHEKPRTNFGLYFTFWDRVLGTTDANYVQRFERAARGDRPCG